MKKLNILKTIVDYLWMISISCYPLIVLYMIFVILTNKKIDIPLKINGQQLELTDIWNKLAFLMLIIGFGLLLFALFKFRRLLQLFKYAKIFEFEVSILFKEIGILIICYSFIDLLAELILKLSENTIEVNFGFSSFLSFLSLGLFLLVLSEVFSIGLNMKVQNELTI